MEDDDEFGDLYTDVLRPVSSSSAPQELPSSSAVDSASRPIDPKLHSDDEEILYGAPNSNLSSSSKVPDQTFDVEAAAAAAPVVAAVGESAQNLGAADKLEEREVGKDEILPGVLGNWALDSPGRSGSRVLESGDVKVDGAREDRDQGDKSCQAGEKDEGGDGGGGFVDKGENLVVEEGGTGIEDVGSEPVIPGLSIGGASEGVENRTSAQLLPGEDVGGEGDDWDSDSEDDLQIVLNDNTHGPMAMDRGAVGSDDEDEDGEPLVIVADVDPNHQTIEEQEWTEDAAQTADGEKKDMGETGKVNGPMVVAPKIGYSNHGYHPFHSQFKYVRPGAAPMPGATTGGPGGALGQVRPLVNMGPIAGRGRGDWRPTGIKTAPSMQKNYHSNFAPWGNNMLGRGFGVGLEFTLPSHKTIFDVDIDGFEEKPWKLPAVDISDFFNFGLNEDSWKDYSKQLEQLRLEATMQSKIRVYESGRTEQDYDPDLPPELAAAAGIHDVTAENANSGKTDAGQGDLAKGSARVRPPLPTGRAIQVEGGYGERLPSIDTRPPRIRDSDAIIEIVLQDSVDDDSSTGNGVLERPDNDNQGEDFRGLEDDNVRVNTEYYDEYPHTYNNKKGELAGRRAPIANSVRDNIPERDGISSLPPDAPRQRHPGSSGDFGTSNEEKQTKERTLEGSPQVSPSQSSQDKTSPDDNQNEESLESIDGKHSPPLSSPVTVGAAGEQSDEHEHKVDEHSEQILADGGSQVERGDTNMDIINADGTDNDEQSLHCSKKQKLSSRVEQPVLMETDDVEDLKGTRSTETSKARSGSSKDYQKCRDGTEDEVVQDRHSTRSGNVKRHIDEDEPNIRRHDRNAKLEVERNRAVVKGREESYSNTAHHSSIKIEAFDRRRERDISDGAWQRRDEDPHSRRIRAEDTRKRERGDEMGSRHRGKGRESERSDKDEHLHLRKQVDNGSWRGHRDKELGSRHRERDDNLKSRYDNVDDLHSKRRKDEEYPRKDHADKDDILYGYRESTSRRKRERDDVLEQRKRDDQPRMRDNIDDLHSVRHKDDSWLQRERSERQRERERDEWHRLKQSHEESMSKREREEGRGATRSGRVAEDKAWVNHARVKDEYNGSEKDYQMKDIGRHGEQLKRRDRIEGESLSQHRGRDDAYARGSQYTNEDRRLRQERSNTRSDRMDNQKLQEKKYKDNTKKSRDYSEGGDHNAVVHSRRNQEHSSHINEMVSLKGSEQGNNVHEILVHRHSSRKQREDASSDDEQQDSRRGRSKLERWTSHKERDYSINTKSSSSLKLKEIDGNNNGGSSLASKLSDESLKTAEAVDNQLPLAEERETGDLEMKDADTKPMEDRHLDTVEKLKKRSERFKLPMPSEKETTTIKKMDNEAPLPSVQGEAPVDSVVKPERPARKRRWISN
ncbi:FIP1[V]-like protein [Malania oleifera]|uniref:FIP1[V]-like protein n=1 Tax=Malania oleifera TaxID=397392 RepID=UPI0025AE0EC0|nr:FIP1[V]-like protein [Malania oleifera]